MTLQDVAFFAVLALGLYLLLIRPQRSRARAVAEVRAGLAVGVRVMTTAGIHATVAELDPDGDTVLLEVSPGVRVRFATAAVVRILETVEQPADEPGAE
jgi:preprotein translocase subunit YajC